MVSALSPMSTPGRIPNASMGTARSTIALSGSIHDRRRKAREGGERPTTISTKPVKGIAYQANTHQSGEPGPSKRAEPPFDATAEHDDSAHSRRPPVPQHPADEDHGDQQLQRVRWTPVRLEREAPVRLEPGAKQHGQDEGHPDHGGPLETLGNQTPCTHGRTRARALAEPREPERRRLKHEHTGRSAARLKHRVEHLPAPLRARLAWEAAQHQPPDSLADHVVWILATVFNLGVHRRPTPGRICR